MGTLSAEQRQIVEGWAAEGASLNDIQDRLKREFGITLTYLEARLLMTDLAVKIQDKAREKPEVPEDQSEATVEAESADALDAIYDHDDDLVELAAEAESADEVESEQDGAAGSVQVEAHELAVPGTLISGKVTFSDGKSVDWFIDQFGRLGMRGAEPGYQPPPADIPVFQDELERVLQRRGF